MLPGMAVPRVPRLSREEFLSTVLLHGPVVITDDIGAWAGTTPRTFEGLRERWGNRSVRAWVTADGEWNHESGRRDVPFTDLIDAALATAPPGYRVSGPQLDLRRDIPWAGEGVSEPAFVPAEHLAGSNLWLQAAGDKTHLHWDASHGLLALLHGEKHIVLFSPQDRRALYPIGSGTGVNWSRVDFWRWDADALPLYKDARPIPVTLRAGEMLFVPATWWHCVHTIEPSIALNYWWTEPTVKIDEAYKRLGVFDELMDQRDKSRTPTQS